MKTGKGTKLRDGGRAATPEIVSGEGLGGFASKIQDAIAHRAYELFEARGYQNGHDLEDWFRAESELLHPVKVKDLGVRTRGFRDGGDSGSQGG